MLSQWSISALVQPIYEADPDLCYAIIQVPMMSPAHPSPHPHRGCPHEHSPALPALNSLSQDLPPRSLRSQHLQRGFVQCGGWRRGKVQESQKAFLKGMVHLT